MSITEIAIKRPILFIVLFLIIGGFGIMAYKNLKYELLPDLAIPMATVFTAYPGASPKEVENSITKKIEDAVAGVSKIKKVTANSSENISIVSIEFLADADADQAVQEVQRAISKILPELPNGVKSPSIEKFNVNDAPVLRLGITSNSNETELYNIIKNQIKPRISQLKSVGRISILGGAEQEIKILINQQKMISYGISNAGLSEAVRRSNGDIPLGSIKDTDAQLGIRITGKFTDFTELENLSVKSFSDGSSIKLKDVATIQSGTKETEVINRLNSTPSIGLFISKQNGANAVEVSKLVRSELTKLENEYKTLGLKFSVAQDSSEFTVSAANAVYHDFFIALILVALVMLVFLHSLRNALIVMLAIPTSLVSAFIMMYFMDYSLNLMTLLAMSLVIGVLVDDSIVVLENIYRHLEMGKDKEKAALDGSNEIGFAALSITLVIVVVFLPLALVPGLVGSLVKQFSLVIVVSTLFSLLVCFTLTPMIASRFAKLEHLNKHSFFGKIGLFFESGINGFTNWYVSILEWSLKNKIATLSITLALMIGAFSLVGTGIVGSEFTPATDKGELSLLINMQPGTKLSETDTAVKLVEDKIKAIPEVTKVFTNIGYQADGFNENYSSHVAAINISLRSAKERKKSLQDLSREIRVTAMQVPGVKARVSPIGLFGANDAPIQILVSGTNRDTIMETATTILNTMRGINGVVNPRLSAEQGKPEIDIVINKEKAASLGLSLEDIGANMRNAINGYDELKFRSNNEEVNVRIQLQEEERSNTASLKQYSFINDKGQVIYLNQFADINLKSSPNNLERRNKQASVIVLSQVIGRPVGDIGADIKSAVAKSTIPDGVKISYEGDLELQDDSFGSLGLALLTSFMLIYLIMVALYNNWMYPFVVLFSIPVSVVGAFLALALTAKSLNIFSIFGLIMMMGLVAKNAILLVDKTNDNRKEGLQLFPALIDAGKTRLRPILMTTLAMVIGMLPLALAKGAGAELNSGLAWVLIGGLSSSMFLTLLVVPVVYYILTRLMEKINSWKRNNKVSYTTKNIVQQIPTAISIIILFVTLSLSTKAQDLKLTIKDAVNIGLANNSQIKLAELEEIKAKYNTKEATSNLYPNISASGAYTRNIKAPIFFFPSFGQDPVSGGITIDDKNLVPVVAAANNVYSTTATLSMPVWNKEINSSIKAAKVNERLAKVNTLVSKSQLATEIQKAYYNVLVSKSGSALVEQSIKRAELFLKSSIVLQSQGLALDADTLSAYVNLETIKINRYKSNTAINQSINYLKNLTGIAENMELIFLDSLAASTITNETLEKALTTALSKRPELLQNGITNEAAKAQLQIDQSRYYPNLSFISQYQIQTQSNDFQLKNYTWPNSFFLGLQVNIPIFSGFKNDIKVRQTKTNIQQLAIQKEQLGKQITLEVKNAYLSQQEAYFSWQAQSNILPSAERNLQLITSRWQKGISKYNEVADAELTLSQAKNNQLQAAYNFLMAKTDYLKATNTSF